MNTAVSVFQTLLCLAYLPAQKGSKPVPSNLTNTTENTSPWIISTDAILHETEIVSHEIIKILKFQCDSLANQHFYSWKKIKLFAFFPFHFRQFLLIFNVSIVRFFFISVVQIWLLLFCFAHILCVSFFCNLEAYQRLNFTSRFVFLFSLFRFYHHFAKIGFDKCTEKKAM